MILSLRRRASKSRRRPAPLGGRRRGSIEDRVLGWIFMCLLGGVVAVLAVDFHQLSNRPAFDRGVERTSATPEVLDPAAPNDHVRRYLPTMAPTRPNGAPPDLPGLGVPDVAALGERMTFTRGPDGAASAVGRIEPGAAEDFEAFLETQGGEVRRLYLHSPGGSVRDALGMARLARENDIETVAPNDAYCASSCPIILAGGVERRVGEAAYIGVHQIFAADETAGDLDQGLSEAQTLTAAIQAQLGDHGVDPALWIHAMETSKHELYLLTREQLLEYALATEILPR